MCLKEIYNILTAFFWNRSSSSSSESWPRSESSWNDSPLVEQISVNGCEPVLRRCSERFCVWESDFRHSSSLLFSFFPRIRSPFVTPLWARATPETSKSLVGVLGFAAGFPGDPRAARRLCCPSAPPRLSRSLMNAPDSALIVIYCFAAALRPGG